MKKRVLVTCGCTWTPIDDVRVISNAEDVCADARELAALYEDAGYEVIEQAGPYPCREPQEYKSRVFIKLMKAD